MKVDIVSEADLVSTTPSFKTTRLSSNSVTRPFARSQRISC